MSLYVCLCLSLSLCLCLSVCLSVSPFFSQPFTFGNCIILPCFQYFLVYTPIPVLPTDTINPSSTTRAKCQAYTNITFMWLTTVQSMKPSHRPYLIQKEQQYYISKMNCTREKDQREGRRSGGEGRGRTHAHTHARTHARTHAHTHTHTHTHTLTHSHNQSPTGSLTHSLIHSITHWLAHSLIHPLDRSLTHLVTSRTRRNSPWSTTVETKMSRKGGIGILCVNW